MDDKKEQQKEYRYGILGSGRIAHDFTLAMKAVTPGRSRVYAVASRDMEKSKEFAERHRVEKAYGDYESLLADPDVDIVYIATVNTEHCHLSMMASENKKHVLVEKPMAINSDQVAAMVHAAKKNNTFLMEGLWTRFFPSVRKAREVLKNGEIGEIKKVFIDFGFAADANKAPRLFDKSVAGGALLDIGVYCISYAPMVFSTTMPEVTWRGILGETGVDIEGGIFLCYKEKKAMVNIGYSFQVATPGQMIIVGTNGRITLTNTLNAPKDLSILKRNADMDSKEEEFHFDLPVIDTDQTFNFGSGAGLAYEIEAVAGFLDQNLKECPEYTLDESLLVASILDTCRQQMGLVYPDEEGASGYETPKQEEVEAPEDNPPCTIF